MKRYNLPDCDKFRNVLTFPKLEAGVSQVERWNELVCNKLLDPPTRIGDWYRMGYGAGRCN